MHYHKHSKYNASVNLINGNYKKKMLIDYPPQQKQRKLKLNVTFNHKMYVEMY